MSIRERNLQNILSRWKRQHENEFQWIISHRETDLFKARICGYLAGDGTVSIRKERNTNTIHHEIRFFPDHESLIEPYISAFRKAYNKEPKVKKRNNFYEIRINSKIVARDLLSICSFGTQNWTIPNFTNLKCKIEWLRALFDSDAYVGKDYIRIKMINKNGIESIKKLLNEFDIETSKIYSYKPPNKKWSINYILDIRKRGLIKRFSKNIGFNHVLKREKLLNLVNKF